MKRLLALLVTLVAAWLGVMNPATAVAAPTQSVPVFTYDTKAYDQPTDGTALERGPPATSHAHTTYPAVDHWSRGDAPRPELPATTTTYTYNESTELAQFAAGGAAAERLASRTSAVLLSSSRSQAAADAATEIPAAARTRPSFRRGTERDALASAPRAPDGGAMCPGCQTPIGRGQIEFGGRLRRDFDLDHYGQTWAERIRAMPSDITRPEVIDAYQEMVRATCRA